MAERNVLHVHLLISLAVSSVRSSTATGTLGGWQASPGRKQAPTHFLYKSLSYNTTQSEYVCPVHAYTTGCHIRVPSLLILTRIHATITSSDVVMSSCTPTPTMTKYVYTKSTHTHTYMFLHYIVIIMAHLLI